MAVPQQQCALVSDGGARWSRQGGDIWKKNDGGLLKAQEKGKKKILLFYLISLRKMIKGKLTSFFSCHQSIEQQALAEMPEILAL